MAAGGHFGFWPLLGLAHTFTRGIGAQFFLNTSKYPNPLSNLPLLSVVTGGPNMTLLKVKPFTIFGKGQTITFCPKGFLFWGGGRNMLTFPENLLLTFVSCEQLTSKYYYSKFLIGA